MHCPNKKPIRPLPMYMCLQELPSCAAKPHSMALLPTSPALNRLHISVLTVHFFFLVLQSHAVSGRYHSIFSFGDSLADTGNFLVSGALKFPSIGRLPYGQTYFRRPTGRCSDGRLIIDFIAEAFGLPMLPPYLVHSNGRNPRQGMNFAVAGATALDFSFFHERNLNRLMWTNDSLNHQLRWFEELKPSLCHTTKECACYFGKSLFFVGEIGGNDYNYAFFQGASMKQVQSFVPEVVGVIACAISRLIEQGAVNIVVPGNLPIGCSATYLTLFYTPNKAAYNPRNGCISALNRFSQYHNSQLQRAIQGLRRKHPHTNIFYADYYAAAMRFFNSPQHFGFSSGCLVACCGGGGPYNFNVSARCGHHGSTACSNPSTHANWDGVHLTEAAYRIIAHGLIHGPYSSPPLHLHA